MRRVTFELLNNIEEFEFPDSYTDEDIDDEFKGWVEWQTIDALWEEAT